MGEVGGFNGLHDGLDSQNESLTICFHRLEAGDAMGFAFFLGDLEWPANLQVVSRQ